MALVQQAVGQQREVGHGVGLHGFEGRVCHDGLQRLLAQWPAQELADALHGAAEILGAEEASAEGGDPRPGRGTRPRIWMPEPPPLESGWGGQDSASLPQFPHLQVEGLGRGFWGVLQCGLLEVLWGQGKDGSGSEVTAGGRGRSSISCRVNAPLDSKLVCAQPCPAPGPRRALPFTQGQTPGLASAPLPPYPLPLLPPSVVSP